MLVRSLVFNDLTTEPVMCYDIRLMYVSFVLEESMKKTIFNLRLLQPFTPLIDHFTNVTVITSTCDLETIPQYHLPFDISCSINNKGAEWMT